MSNKLYEETHIQDIANAIREKNKTNNTYKIAEMPDAIRDIQTGIEPITIVWEQMPTAVKNFINNVEYNSSDYTTSEIVNYAPATAVITNTYPVGVSIPVESGILDRNGYELSVTSGTVELVNDIPNEYTEYTVRNNGEISQVGTLKPTGFLRQIKCNTRNVRDLGGWDCDGGTIKYGKLFRGGEFQIADLDVFVNQLGIKHELNLRGIAEADSEPTILRDYISFTCPEKYVWYTINNTYNETWKEIIRCIFDAVKNNTPVYFHCSAGADRTGTVACILEAILGVSQSDIDKDYELTCFASGTGTDNQARRRNESDWKGLINQITALSVGTTFRDKVLNWVASLGFTVDEINAFRRSMIDGTPDTITLNIGTQSITNTLTNVITSNEQTTITKYQPYNAEISVLDGYAISSVKITMGGTDITSSVFKGTKTNLYRAITKNLTNCLLDNERDKVIDGQGYVCNIVADDGYTLEGGTITITMGGVDMATYYSDGKIAIPNVTGDIVITAIAVGNEPTVVTIPITWLEKTNCSYNVGSACTTSSNAGYFITEEINVEYGKTYTAIFNLSNTASSFRWIGINASGIVTEAISNAFVKGEHSYSWTPTATNTTKLRLRGYSDYGTEMMTTTELTVTD